MAVTRRTLRLAEQLRIVIDSEVNWSVRQLVQAWARAWQVVDGEWTRAVEHLAEISREGRWPAEAEILRATTTQAALASTVREIVDLAEFAGVTVVTGARNVSTEVALWQKRLIASQLPQGWKRGEDLPEKLPDQVLAAIVERTSGQVESWRRRFPDAVAETMKQELIRGVVLGENPRTAARRMVEIEQQRFNGGLTRAMVLARTEILDAYRSGAGAYHAAHDDVLAGWIWAAKLDARTCPSCWAQHGRSHSLFEPGPEDHQCGRCTRLPMTRSWRSLGIDMDEPESFVPNAQEAFAALTRAEQLQVMGPVRLQALETGALSWRQLTVKRKTDGWRDSWVPVSVGDARRALVSLA